MSERKHWKAEEKLALINEIKDKGHVVEVQRLANNIYGNLYLNLLKQRK